MQTDDPVSLPEEGGDPGVTLACVHSGVKDENNLPLSRYFCANGGTIRCRGGEQVALTGVIYTILHQYRLLIIDKSGRML
jgi:hypothetical protein